MADVKISEIATITSLNDSDLLLIEQSSAGTKTTTYKNIKDKIIGTSNISGTGPDTSAMLVTDNIRALNQLVSYSASNNNAAVHNSIGRGKLLGTSVTTEQWAAIKAGNFQGMYIGDYWTINAVVWRIAAFDYYYGKRNTSDHHVVIVPDSRLADSCAMGNSASNANGYKGSLVYSTHMATARTAANNAFGNGHILSHNMPLSTSVTDGLVTSTESESVDLVLMNMNNVFGFAYNYMPISTGYMSAIVDDDATQFPLFMLYPQKIRSDSGMYWLRTAIGSDGFSVVTSAAVAGKRSANTSESTGIRPCFCIYST